MKKIFLVITPVMLWLHVQCEVIMTGIMDGTLAGGKPKAIELFITGTEDLGGYEIWRSLNGDPFGSGSGSIAALSGIYNNTFVYLVKSDQVAEFDSVFGVDGFYANVVPLGIVSGNGNEGFQIRDTVGDVVVDQIWMEDPTDSYRDSFWYRIHGTGPDGTWVESNWESPGNDALDDLDEAGLRAAVPFGSYALAWKGTSTDWNEAFNWLPGIVPTEGSNVIIYDTSAFFPVITNPPESPAECLDLTISGLASLSVEAGRALTVNRNLHLTGSPMQGRFVLLCDTTSDPAGSLLLEGQSFDSITIQRYIPKDNAWHFLSAPVLGQPIQPGFANAPPDTTFDFYFWEEIHSINAGWINIRDENGLLNPQFDSVFSPGKGYLAAYSPQYDGSELKMFFGPPLSGETEILLSHQENYWNLLGNPYTCAIDWSSDNIDKSLVAGQTMYIWDQSLNAGAGGYRAHNGTVGVPEGTTPFIPAMNGFFLHTLDSGSITFNTNSLVHTSQAFYKATEDLSEDRVRLKVSREEYSDETLIFFDPTAGNGYDPLLDALKLSNGQEEVPEICSMAPDGLKLCINYLGHYPVSVPLSIGYGFSDSLELMAFDFEAFNPDIGFYLEDLKTGITQNLRAEPVYRYYHEVPGTEVRFILHISIQTLEPEEELQDMPDIFVSGQRIFLTGAENKPVPFLLIDISGRIIEKGFISSSYDVGYLRRGVYIIEIRPEGKVYRRKIIL